MPLTKPNPLNVASGGTGTTTSTGSGNTVLSTGPTLSSPIVGTQTALDNSTKAASTAYTDTAISVAMPSGSIIMYGGSSAPSGYLLCDGSAVSRTTYSALFTAISTTFGTGDGSSTFNVPDMRGVFPKGAGTTSRAAGKDASGNFYAGTLGTYSTDQMQGHQHQVALNVATGGSLAASNAASAPTTINTGSPVDDGTNGTSRTGHTTEPQSLGLTYIIKT